jgi:hypothetical protein
MKNFTLIAFIFLSFTSTCLATDFRDAQWGFTKDQVRLLEKTRPLFSTDNTLTYRGKIDNIQVHIIYEFIEEKLKSGTYKFIANYANNNVYLRDYERINNSIEFKYGEPEIKEETWKNNLYKEKRGYHGNAVSLGHLIFETKWIADNTIIIHKLSGNNNIVDHSIEYHDKKWFDNENEKEKKNGIKGL